MIDRKLLEKKKKLQRIRNMLKVTDGITVLEICDDIHIDIEDYYSAEKIPDSRMSPDEDIYSQIVKRMNLKNNINIFLICEDVPVKVRITDVFAFVRNFWDSYSEITIADENLNKVCEVVNDSRDEYNYLFDVYNVKKSE